MHVHEIGSSEELEIIPQRHGDARGFFSETYNAETWAKLGIGLVFLQDNHSLSAHAGVVRGLHCQLPPHAQDKLARVVLGRIFDVAVDLRRSSPTFGQWACLELTAEHGNQLLIPRGFGHGFVTLEPNTELIYKMTSSYASAADRSAWFDDPAIGIEWPTLGVPFTLSDKDRVAPRFTNAEVFP